MARAKTSRIRRAAALPKAALGRRRETPYTYDASLLEAVPFDAGGRNFDDRAWVSLNCLRFTSLCPVTGQPDWADMYINYVPDARLVESKSLKEYLYSFRMHGDFHEDVCRVICDDLAQLLEPRYLEILGHFDSRGSIAIWPYVQHARAGDADAERIRDHRFLHYHPGRYAPAGYGRQI